MRGCSRARHRHVAQRAVVPAHAGMFPGRQGRGTRCAGGPRACGDVPLVALREIERQKWSPRMRGCSLASARRRRFDTVVPAHAGMFPGGGFEPSCRISGPRACGDVPEIMPKYKPLYEWSPRMRGWSDLLLVLHGADRVVPAHAGMFPLATPRRSRRRGGPRACGDVPDGHFGSSLVYSWSPRMRGCSRVLQLNKQLQCVVPAHARMFPRAGPRGRCARSGPRACGDVPYSATGYQDSP